MMMITNKDILVDKQSRTNDLTLRFQYRVLDFKETLMINSVN